jgi:hypothetical protein
MRNSARQPANSFHTAEAAPERLSSDYPFRDPLAIIIRASHAEPRSSLKEAGRVVDPGRAPSVGLRLASTLRRSGLTMVVSRYDIEVSPMEAGGIEPCFCGANLRRNHLLFRYLWLSCRFRPSYVGALLGQKHVRRTARSDRYALTGLCIRQSSPYWLPCSEANDRVSLNCMLISCRRRMP